MTKTKYRAIGKQLLGSKRNVYELAKSHGYDHEWTDEDFDKLQDITGIFRCPECGTWREAKNFDPQLPEICIPCQQEEAEECPW